MGGIVSVNDVALLLEAFLTLGFRERSAPQGTSRLLKRRWPPASGWERTNHHARNDGRQNRKPEDEAHAPSHTVAITHMALHPREHLYHCPSRTFCAASRRCHAEPAAFAVI
jgi:hypothetical protein